MKELVKQSAELAISNELFEQLNEVFNKIRAQHKQISKKRTPKKAIKQKMGIDYVVDSYMRQVANKEYPGWSFEIISSEIVGSISIPKSMFFKVHGRLKWIDNGIPRTGDMIAAHRIQFKKDKDGNPTDEVVDMGNDFKAAVTDCMKKAFNTYMNISDDVYKKQEFEELSKKEVDHLLSLAKSISKEKYKAVKHSIDNGIVDKSNYQIAVNKLNRELEDK